jgi:hypothetical protein
MPPCHRHLGQQTHHRKLFKKPLHFFLIESTIPALMKIIVYLF